jgi:hypothetical protein
MPKFAVEVQYLLPAWNCVIVEAETPMQPKRLSCSASADQTPNIARVMPARHQRCGLDK